MSEEELDEMPATMDYDKTNLTCLFTEADWEYVYNRWESEKLKPLTKGEYCVLCYRYHQVIVDEIVCSDLYYLWHYTIREFFFRLDKVVSRGYSLTPNKCISCGAEIQPVSTRCVLCANQLRKKGKPFAPYSKTPKPE